MGEPLNCILNYKKLIYSLTTKNLQLYNLFKLFKLLIYSSYNWNILIFLNSYLN